VEIVGTKIRAIYSNYLFLDIYYNKDNNRYDVASIFKDTRILGWDNAPHHRKVSTCPHHRHEFGEIHESDVQDLEKDLPKIIKYIDEFVKRHNLL